MLIYKMGSNMDTFYAPAERAGMDKVRQQAEKFQLCGSFINVFNALPIVVLILNSDRQIVFSNKSLVTYLGLASQEELWGKRPGEALKCKHAFESEGGCGTSEFCRTCGAVKAIMSSLHGNNDVQDCHILQNESSSALDLRVTTEPFELEGEQFVIFSILDISDENRKRALERIFFHDIMNTAGGIKGLTELMKDSPPEEILSLSEMLTGLSMRLIEEISAQKELLAAENDELQTFRSLVNSKDILESIYGIYSNHLVASDRVLKMNKNAKEFYFKTDATLLRRVVGNMTKNALEASDPHQAVTISCDNIDDKVIFSVHNTSFIPRKIQLQIFHRSFSTKGRDRGLGTYSMKLLSEKYLDGTVYFETDKEMGTTFYAEYPYETVDWAQEES